MVNIRHHLEDLARREAVNQGTPPQYVDAFVIGQLGAWLVRAAEDMAFFFRRRHDPYIVELIQKSLARMLLTINEETGELEVME